MTDPSFTSESDRDLLVVLPTHDEAEQAARALLDAGIDPADVQIDVESDRVASLRAEMHEELTEALVVPNAGVAYPKEAARGLVAGELIGVGIGVLAAFPLALIPIADTTYWVRFLIYAVVGVAFGVTVGLVAGPAAGSRRPNEPPAIERGTLLRVRHDSPELRALLADLHPIRMDEIRRADDLPIRTVHTEAGSGLHDTVEDLTRNARGDDYSPDPERPRPDWEGKPTPTEAPADQGQDRRWE